MILPDFHSVFRLDEDTGKLFWIRVSPNHNEKLGKEAGYINVGKGKNKSYWQIRVFSRTFKRSRVIFAMMNGRWPEPIVDHINGDSLDDRPVNLRECDYSQNTANSRQHSRKYDLPKGVYRTVQGKFMARFMGRSLGVYDTPEEAQRIFSTAQKEKFGDFAP